MALNMKQAQMGAIGHRRPAFRAIPSVGVRRSSLKVCAGGKVYADPVKNECKAFAPATVANLGPGFDWMGCAVEVGPTWAWRTMQCKGQHAWRCKHTCTFALARRNGSQNMAFMLLLQFKS